MDGVSLNVCASASAYSILWVCTYMSIYRMLVCCCRVPLLPPHDECVSRLSGIGKHALPVQTLSAEAYKHTEHTKEARLETYVFNTEKNPIRATCWSVCVYDTAAICTRSGGGAHVRWGRAGESRSSSTRILVVFRCVSGFGMYTWMKRMNIAV